MRLLVDTNIFLDLFYNRSNLVDGSRAFFLKSHLLKDEIYISSNTMKDLAYFLKKLTHDNSEVHKKLLNLYQKINKIISSTADDAINAIYEEGDYEDNVLCESATRTMCDAIITRNIRDFSNKQINCLTPEEYLKFRN